MSNKKDVKKPSKKEEPEYLYPEQDHNLSAVANSNGTIFVDEIGAVYSLEHDVISGNRKLVRHNKGKDLNPQMRFW